MSKRTIKSSAKPAKPVTFPVDGSLGDLKPVEIPTRTMRTLNPLNVQFTIDTGKLLDLEACKRRYDNNPARYKRAYAFIKKQPVNVRTLADMRKASTQIEITRTFRTDVGVLIGLGYVNMSDDGKIKLTNKRMR